MPNHCLQYLLAISLPPFDKLSYNLRTSFHQVRSKTKTNS